MAVWDKQPNEGPKPYEAFCVYRDMKYNSEDKNRSIARVAMKLGKSEGLMERWSSKYDWVNRVDVYDQEMERKERELSEKERLDEVKKMRRRHAQLARKALEKVSDALDAVDTEQMSNADISRMMDVASKLERISRGDVGDVIEERDGGEAVSPVQIYIPDNGRNSSDSFEDLEV